MAKKILVVDDEPEIREGILERLKACGFEVVTAENGKKGVEKARTERPDLVLMDLIMPVLDGFQAADTLKKDEATRGIPVIMLTLRAQADDVAMAHACGAVDYIVKPYSPAALIEKVNRALKI
ncbi:MAG: response regulator [Candidatus Omnitrophica bacterium]|nr:response regulator [Candidatus Omnitrophota bacterium]